MSTLEVFELDEEELYEGVYAGDAGVYAGDAGVADQLSDPSSWVATEPLEAVEAVEAVDGVAVPVPGGATFWVVAAAVVAALSAM